MKKLKDLKGIKELSTKEQKEINGGVWNCIVGYSWCWITMKCERDGFCQPLEV